MGATITESSQSMVNLQSIAQSHRLSNADSNNHLKSQSWSHVLWCVDPKPHPADISLLMLKGALWINW
ncbi:hypothetical protein [Aliikangiella sp. G2MR2-5]|uniref:hypothetical protein n=1 Tax=Aliikangiella sp. G2MR2-5 TaxID=2788943 RepID=UPI0018ABB110|nr:hypothetical protein [Aliikangiella sp. G2MR2-5]